MIRAKDLNLKRKNERVLSCRVLQEYFHCYSAAQANSAPILRPADGTAAYEVPITAGTEGTATVCRTVLSSSQVRLHHIQYSHYLVLDT